MAHIYLLQNAGDDAVGLGIKGLGGIAIIQISASVYDGSKISLQARIGSDMNWMTLPYKNGLAEFYEDFISSFNYFVPKYLSIPKG